MKVTVFASNTYKVKFFSHKTAIFKILLHFFLSDLFRFLSNSSIWHFCKTMWKLKKIIAVLRRKKCFLKTKLVLSTRFRSVFAAGFQVTIYRKEIFYLAP